TRFSRDWSSDVCSSDLRDYFLKCKITIIEDGELNGRPCRILDLRSPQPAADFRMAIARIYFDKEWQVPVRYEAFDFPPGDDQGEDRKSVVEGKSGERGG